MSNFIKTADTTLSSSWNAYFYKNRQARMFFIKTANTQFSFSYHKFLAYKFLVYEDMQITKKIIADTTALKHKNGL